MLIIREEQMEALADSRKQNVAYQLAHILQSEYQSVKPNWGLEAYLGVAENSIERGIEYGLNTDNQLYKFAKMIIKFGYGFDSSIEEVQKILVENEEGWIKMNRLDAWAYPDGEEEQGNE